MSDKTKAELIEENKGLQDEVKRLKHLPKAVEAKDSEISRLKKELKEHETASKDNLKEKDAKLKEYEKTERQITAERDNMKKKVEDVTRQNAQMSKENQFLYQYINQYRNAYKSFMMGIQGSLDNSIDLEKFITDKLQQEQKARNGKKDD